MQQRTIWLIALMTLVVMGFQLFSSAPAEAFLRSKRHKSPSSQVRCEQRPDHSMDCSKPMWRRVTDAFKSPFKTARQMESRRRYEDYLDRVSIY